MKTLFKKLTVFLLTASMLLPLISTVFAANTTDTVSDNGYVSAGIIQTSTDLPRLDIHSDADLDNTIYQDKDNKVDATAKISGAEDSRHNLSTSSIELKTRGNTTWNPNKWAYQIKFESKVDLFDMGNAKKWILLANYYDGTFVRNKVMFDLGKEIGIPYVVESVFVDVYINGDYQGIYQLCEKVELGSSRIDIDSDYGVLLEMDASNRKEELDKEIYFTGGHTGKPFVYKEYNTDFEDEENAELVADIRQFTENFIAELEKELYSDDADWETIESMIDVDSFIRYYFISEFSVEVDATYSSTYFYIDGPGDVLHCGPLWDYDRIFGWDTVYNATDETDVDYLKNITDSTDCYRVEWFKMLFRHPEFVERVNKFYDETARDAFNTEKVISMIDRYQALVWPSLVRDHDEHFTPNSDIGYGYYVFHNRNQLVEEILGAYASTEAKLNYTTNAMKQWISDRNEYLEKMYGQYHPVLTYKLYDSAAGKWLPTYTGGCMTYNFATDGQDEPITRSISGLSIGLENCQFDGGIEFAYRRNAKNSAWFDGGEEVRTDSDGTINAIMVRLTGNLANYFDVEYRVALCDSNTSNNTETWESWVKNGTRAGISSGNIHVSKIQIHLVQKKDVNLSAVTFANPVGSSPDAVFGIPGNTVSLEPIQQEGYTFGGWYANEDYSGEALTEITFAEEDTVLYAKLDSNAIKGDIDGDGEVSNLDYFQLKLILAQKLEPTEAQKEAANVDRSENKEPDMLDSFAFKFYLSKGYWA